MKLYVGEFLIEFREAEDRSQCASQYVSRFCRLGSSMVPMLTLLYLGDVELRPS
jgi:hypothetical protein